MRQGEYCKVRKWVIFGKIPLIHTNREAYSCDFLPQLLEEYRPSA